MSKIYTMNKVSADSKHASINILAQIGDSWFSEGVIAKDFADDLKGLGDVDEITVNISSPGGSVIEGMAIYHMLKDHPATITTNNVGTVASIASVIFMAGDTRISPASSLFLAHKPMGGAPMLNADEHRKVAEALDMHEQVISTVYEQATGMSSDDLADFMREEKYIDGVEAVDMGFATEKGTDLKVAASVDDAKLAVHAIEVQSQSDAKDVEIEALRGLTVANVEKYEEISEKYQALADKHAALIEANIGGGIEAMDAKAVIAICADAGCADIAASLIAADSPETRVSSVLESIEEIRNVCVAADIPDNATIVAMYDNPAEMIKAVIVALQDEDGGGYIAPNFHADTRSAEPLNAVKMMDNFKQKRGK